MSACYTMVPVAVAYGKSEKEIALKASLSILVGKTIDNS